MFACAAKEHSRNTTSFRLHIADFIHLQTRLWNIDHVTHIQEMPSPALHGLQLNRSERIIVVTLSYLFCAPTIWINGKRILAYLLTTSSEARRRIREEQQARRRNQPNQPAQAA